jgi:hypothetical protein
MHVSLGVCSGIYICWTRIGAGDNHACSSPVPVKMVAHELGSRHADRQMAPDEITTKSTKHAMHAAPRAAQSS